MCRINVYVTTARTGTTICIWLSHENVRKNHELWSFQHFWFISGLRVSVLVKLKMIYGSWMSLLICLLNLHTLIFHHKLLFLSSHVSLCLILSGWGNVFLSLFVQRAHYLYLKSYHPLRLKWVDAEDINTANKNSLRLNNCGRSR